MRFLITLFFLLTIISTGCLKKTVEISGKLKNPKQGEYIFIDELKSDKLVTLDSIIVADNGTFNFKFETKDTAFFLLKLNKANFLTMLIGPGEKLTIEADHDSLNFPASVTGSRGTALLAEYNKTLRATIKKLENLNKRYMQYQDSTNLPVLIQSLDSLAQIYMTDINTYTKKYIDKNIGSLVSLVALYQQIAPSVYVLNPSMDLDYFLKVDSSLSANYPNYEPVKALHSQVQDFTGQAGPEKTAVTEAGAGAEAPEIALPSPQGDTIRLSSTRGSIVLLDFWASWCAPCRNENPNLVKAYNQYHRKGFQIYQVSLDKTKEGWMMGIQDDHLEKWIHVSDIKYWNSIVVPLYNIESIPANFLLDRDGKIIASNLRGEILQNKLAELFAN